MDEQYYRLERSWEGDEFPLSTDMETLDHLSRVAPDGYSYRKRMSHNEELVELYEHVGSGVDEE